MRRRGCVDRVDLVLPLENLLPAVRASGLTWAAMEASEMGRRLQVALWRWGTWVSLSESLRIPVSSLVK